MNNFAKFLILFFTCSTLSAMENNQQKTFNADEYQNETGFAPCNVLENCFSPLINPIEMGIDSEPEKVILDDNQLNYIVSIMVENNESCACGFNTANKVALKDHLKQCENFRANQMQYSSTEDDVCLSEISDMCSTNKRKFSVVNESSDKIQGYYEAKKQKIDAKDTLPPISTFFDLLPASPVVQTEQPSPIKQAGEKNGALVTNSENCICGLTFSDRSLFKIHEERVLASLVEKKYHQDMSIIAAESKGLLKHESNLAVKETKGTHRATLINNESKIKCICGLIFINEALFRAHAERVSADPIEKKYHQDMFIIVKSLQSANPNHHSAQVKCICGLEFLDRALFIMHREHLLTDPVESKYHNDLAIIAKSKGLLKNEPNITKENLFLVTANSSQAQNRCTCPNNNIPNNNALNDNVMMRQAHMGPQLISRNNAPPAANINRALPNSKATYPLAGCKTQRIIQRLGIPQNNKPMFTPAVKKAIQIATQKNMPVFNNMPALTNEALERSMQAAMQNVAAQRNISSQSAVKGESTQLVENLVNKMLNENKKCYCGYDKHNKAQLKFHVLSHLISKKNELDIEIQNQVEEMIKKNSSCYCGFKSQNKTIVFIHLMTHAILS